MKKIFLLSLFCSLSVGLYSDNPDKVFSGSLLLFGEHGSRPVLLDSGRDWTPIGRIDWNDQNSGPVQTGDRFRLKSRYEHEGSGAPSTVQVRIRNSSGISVFTHPWAQSVDSSSDNYSNWFEGISGGISAGGSSLVEARLVAPPRTPIQGKLYSVSLESWALVQNHGPESQRMPDVQLAYARPLPAVENTTRQSKDMEVSSAEAALDFSLDFVEHCLVGDLASYYRSQSDTVRSLNDGTTLRKYRLPPPEGIPEIDDIETYKRRFEYRLYDQDVYGKMFPEWFEPAREWSPPKEAFLFMGHVDRLGISDLSAVDFLVFLVGLDENGAWKVIARPE